MKGIILLFLVLMAFRAIKMEDSEEDREEEPEDLLEIQPVNLTGTYAEDDDNEGRNLESVELYTDDERCIDIGVCSDMVYDRNVVVTFTRKPEIRFTSTSTYTIKEPKNSDTLTFINSKFVNFPLNLFYAFKIQELDFRNCSLETVKWDNFLMADKLTILLLSENHLREIRPMLFTYAENLSFLFLDSNELSVLYNESFKGLEKLNYLDLHNNRIETLPRGLFSYLTSIQQINLAENRLKAISQQLFANNPRLFSIHLQYNDLEELHDKAFRTQDKLTYLDVSHNPNLKVLVCDNIRVENLWAKNCSLNRVNIYGEAVHVDLQGNSIKELYFNQPEYLETLRLKDNALEQIASLARTTNLRTLDLSNNPIMDRLPDLWQIHSLERLDLSNTSLKQIPFDILASPNRLKSLNVSFNLIEEINPTNFKYIEKLSQFYIHHNNWNCYQLQMLMEMVMKPLRISYTHDEYDNDFIGEYIQGIKCMYRLEQNEDPYYVDSSSSSQQFDSQGEQDSANISPDKIQEYNVLKFENTKEVEKLRRELKAIVNFYEQKFAYVFDKLTSMDMRLKEFERFNQTLWRDVAIVV